MKRKIIIGIMPVLLGLATGISSSYGWNDNLQREVYVNSHLSNWMKDRTFSIYSTSGEQRGLNELSAAIQSSIPGVADLKTRYDRITQSIENTKVNYREFVKVDYPQFQEARLRGQFWAGLHYGSRIVLDVWSASAHPAGTVANVASNALGVGSDLALNRRITGDTGGAYSCWCFRKRVKRHWKWQYCCENRQIFGPWGSWGSCLFRCYGLEEGNKQL